MGVQPISGLRNSIPDYKEKENLISCTVCKTGFRFNDTRRAYHGELELTGHSNTKKLKLPP